MYTQDIAKHFSQEQLEVFATADAMFGMSFPYMNAVRPSAAHRPFRLFGLVLAHAAKTPLAGRAAREASARPALAPR